MAACRRPATRRLFWLHTREDDGKTSPNSSVRDRRARKIRRLVFRRARYGQDVVRNRHQMVRGTCHPACSNRQLQQGLSPGGYDRFPARSLGRQLFRPGASRKAGSCRSRCRNLAQTCRTQEKLGSVIASLYFSGFHVDVPILMICSFLRAVVPTLKCFVLS